PTYPKKLNPKKAFLGFSFLGRVCFSGSGVPLTLYPQRCDRCTFMHARDANTHSPSAVAILHFAHWTL
ncbi:MAG: hypothetical protein ACK53Y_20310, partial [bacterium]